MVSGVEKAIGSMSVKESARIQVKPQYAYGEEGCADLGIPGGAELVYEVRLNKFTKVSKSGAGRDCTMLPSSSVVMV